jgi:hypothetical protein
MVAESDKGVDDHGMNVESRAILYAIYQLFCYYVALFTPEPHMIHLAEWGVHGLVE